MIVCAAIINVYGSSLRDFGPINIHTFWVSNGSVKIKRKNSKTQYNSHITDLEKFFPENKLLEDKES